MKKCFSIYCLRCWLLQRLLKLQSQTKHTVSLRPHPQMLVYQAKSPLLTSGLLGTVTIVAKK
jgi:hypothetical protein